MIVTNGNGNMKVQVQGQKEEDKEMSLQEGGIFFIGQGVPVTMSATTDKMRIYRAYAE